MANGLLQQFYSVLYSGTVAQNIKNPALAIGQIRGNLVRRHVSTGDEADHDLSGTFFELRFGVASTDAQLDNFLSTPAPAFDQAAKVEDISQ